MFKLSLYENAIVENSYLQKIAGKNFDDFYNLMQYIETESEIMPDLEVKQPDVEDFIAVAPKSLVVRDVVL